MLEICLRLNIKCVSAYAFAIDNFKRSEEEVAALMALAEEKLTELCKHGYVRYTIEILSMSSSFTETYWMNMVCG
jgi:undecaprenyl diphosphate synthase